MSNEEGYEIEKNFRSSQSTLEHMDQIKDLIEDLAPETIQEYQDLIDNSLKTQVDPKSFISNAIVDLRTGNIKQVKDNNGDWWILHGDCNRCGECCEDRIGGEGSGKWKCNYMRAPMGSENPKASALFTETVDGKFLYGCRLHWSKPWGCKIYPYDPHETLYPSCSYSWEKLDSKEENEK